MDVDFRLILIGLTGVAVGFVAMRYSTALLRYLFGGRMRPHRTFVMEGSDWTHVSAPLPAPSPPPPDIDAEENHPTQDPTPMK